MAAVLHAADAAVDWPVTSFVDVLRWRDIYERINDDLADVKISSNWTPPNISGTLARYRMTLRARAVSDVYYF